MSNVRSFLMMIALLIGVALLCSGWAGEGAGTKLKAPDLIHIDLPAAAGSEMPPVKFLHTAHSKAVEGQCAQCHEQKDDRFVFKFKRTDQDASMALYHDNCIACHTQRAAAKKESGPMEAQCRACHGAPPEPAQTSWKEIVFSRALHYTHENSENIKPSDGSMEDNCSACHHEYNEKSKETYYKKGEESSCAYCHKQEAADGIRSIRDASHDACVACHAKLQEQQIPAGPATCFGCHDEKEQAKIKIAENIPRLKRSQPDEVFMTGLTSQGDNPQYLMPPVAFNHKLHEGRTQSCKTCHHESLKACDSCHTPTGDKKGDFIRLEQAMHTVQSDASCVGCHSRETQAADCAGCHDLQSRTKISENSCASCHNAPDNTIVTDEKMATDLAKETLARISDTYDRIMVEKIPETVDIGVLSSEYKASRFPHRKVVLAVFERAEKSSLARTFHQEQLTLCSGCHHNSPKSLEPVKCASCHGRTTDLVSGRPDLKAAYHGQCITCHQKMQVKKVLPTDCTKCHEKK